MKFGIKLAAGLFTLTFFAFSNLSMVSAQTSLSKRFVCKEVRKFRTNPSVQNLACLGAGLLEALFLQPNTRAEQVCEEGKSDCLSKLADAYDVNDIKEYCQKNFSRQVTYACPLSRKEISDCRQDYIKIIEAHEIGSCRELLNEIDQGKNGQGSNKKIELPASCKQVVENCPKIANKFGFN